MDAIVGNDQMRNDIYDIKNFRVTSCEESAYVVPQRVLYTQDGQEKFWDIVRTHDSVSVFLFHRDKDAIVLVKQFRPSVYLNNQDGFTYELCAGIVDKDLNLVHIAREEILEECGYDLPESQIEKVTSFYTSVGFSGGKQSLFYAEIDDTMKVNHGGGIDQEMIEVVYLPIEEAKSFIMDEKKAKTPGLMFAFLWFLENRYRG